MGVFTSDSQGEPNSQAEQWLALSRSLSLSLIFIYLKTLLKMKTVLPKGQHWEVVFKNPATNPVSNHPPQVSVSA